VATALPPLDGGQLLTLHLGVVPTVAVVVAGALYLAGERRVGRLDPARPWSRRRTTAFVAGLVVLLVATDTFLGRYGRELFWVHMVQHLLFVMVAAGCLAMGAPFELAARATTGRVHRWGAAFRRSGAGTVVDHPAFAYCCYAALVPVTHLTGLFNVTVRSPLADGVENAAFVVVGLLFWRQVAAVEPLPRTLHPGLRLLLLGLAVPVDTFTGLALSLASVELFPALAGVHRTWGPSLLTDLHVGGAIMWVGGDMLMAAAMVPVAVQLVRHEERRTREIDRELDAAQARDRAAAGGPTA
jgi:putative copper resistance protein D